MRPCLPLLLILLALLTGCGNKGPLTLPGDPTDTSRTRD
jgi:predicted small lipoprotein YifL